MRSTLFIYVIIFLKLHKNLTTKSYPGTLIKSLADSPFIGRGDSPTLTYSTNTEKISRDLILLAEVIPQP